MRKLVSILALCVIIPTTYAQTFDTLKTYDVFLEQVKTNWGMDYKVNGKSVSVEKYNYYKMHWNAAYACKPCYLATMDAEDHVLHFALQYQNCLVGVYREFYPEGGIKVEGQYKTDSTGNFDAFLKQGNCNLRTGKWTYYGEQGSKTKSEIYDNGKLVKVEEFKNGTKTQLIDTEEGQEETESKKPLGEKIKSKFKPKEKEDPYLEKNFPN